MINEFEFKMIEFFIFIFHYSRIFHPRTMFRLRNLYRNNHYNRKKTQNNNDQKQNNHHNTNANENGSSACTNGPNCSNNCIKYSFSSSTNCDQVEISISAPNANIDNIDSIILHNNNIHHNQNPRQQQRVFLNKISPDLCPTFRRILSHIRYFCCAYCCCCCPIKWIPPPPSLSDKSPSSSSSRQMVKSASLTCSRHFSPSAIVSMIWIISLILSIPHSLFSKIVHHDYVEMTRCTINNFPDEKTKYWLTIYTFITQYILPIGITSFCYLHIGVFLWRRETIGLISERKRLLLLQRKRKRIRLLIMVVATFALCWLPLNLYVLFTDLGFITHHHIRKFYFCKFCEISFKICSI